MNTTLMIIAYVLMAVLIFKYAFSKGKTEGKKEGKKDASECNMRLLKFYQNQSKKQAAQIERIQNRMVYLTVGDLEEFVTFMKDEDGYAVDENYPVLAIVGSLHDAQFHIEGESREKRRH